MLNRFLRLSITFLLASCCSLLACELELYALNAGQGNLLLVKNRDTKKSLLIDCGFGDKVFEMNGITKIKKHDIIKKVSEIV